MKCTLFCRLFPTWLLFTITLVASITMPSPRNRVWAAEANQLTAYEARSGWQLLFDGQSLDEWRGYQHDESTAGWNIEGGALVANQGATDLLTRQQFEHFELTLDYQISAGGNSGVLFRVTEDSPKAWHSGPEVQLLDNAGHRSREKSGWLYGLYQPTVPPWSIRGRKAAGIPVPTEVDATRPPGAWNQLYLRVSDAQCEVALNGVHYYHFRIGDEEWDRRVAASKFSRFPNFAKSSKGHVALQYHGSKVAFRNLKIRPLTPGGEALQQPIDGQLALVGELAFPRLSWEGWQPINEDGQVDPLRFIELTHDGGDQLFAVDQGGRVFAFGRNRQAQEARLFLDLRERVSPWSRRNEEGLLGFAPHPDFAQVPKVYAYYSSRQNLRTSILSEFQLTADRTRVLASSERVLLQIKQPFHNHNGGCIAFGPDKLLYVALGDGGDRNDPFGHGQNRETWLGSILRIDVQPTESRAYTIPPDNPFVDTPGAQAEIYAYGLRNVWRMAFDRTTGQLWAADVGQDLWEEINLIKPGGNYGWNHREGDHPFGNAAGGTLVDAVEPIWQYDHRIGKSVTGGRVYRGQRLPELVGKYLYADYVAGRIWALHYDAKLQRVVSNEQISAGGIPVLAFGEDSEGEVYYMTAAASGKAIFRFVREDRVKRD